MARGFQGAMMRGFGARDHTATVIETVDLAPHFRRIRMTSPTLFDDVTAEPTAWLRFWFPDPDGGETEHQRGYTLSEADEHSGEFAVDVVLHEPSGPAATWARRATPGMTIPVTTLGSSRFAVADEPPAGYLVIGDSASVPAINAILAAVPHDIALEVYLEQHTDDDRLLPLVEHPRATIHWVPRAGTGSLAAAIESRDWTDWYAWVGCESGSLKPLRLRLRDEFGFPRSEVHAQAYWYEGRAFGSRRGPKDAGPAMQSAPPVATDPVPEGEPEPVPTAVDEPTPPPKAWRANAAGRLLAPLKPALVAAGVAQAIITLLQLTPFVLLVEFARALLSGAQPGRLWGLGIAAVVILGVGALLRSALLWWLHVVDSRYETGLRERLLDTLGRLPLGWFTARGSGTISRIVPGDTLALHHLVTHAVPDAVAAVTAPIAVLVYLFVVDWRLALVLLLPVLVYVVVMWIMLVQSGARPAQAMAWADRMATEATGYLDGQPVVRVFGGAAAATFGARLGDYIAFLNDWQKPFTSKKIVLDLATRPATFLWLIMAVGVPMVVTGATSPITLLPFLFLGTTFGARLLGVGYGLSGIRDGVLAARRLQNTLDEPVLQTRVDPGPDRGDAVPAGTVELVDVQFGYRPGVPVVQGISLRLDPGTVTALVGPSGSGKSTLAGLVARFHDVTGGEIRVGGRDIRTLGADELYEQVGFVFQDTQLVHGTVAENIALAVPDCGAERIERAARAARIHERIMQLPHGYDTLLGGDIALSGGEQQRLAIARAIVADTPVLVLDEATAFADPESEYEVQQALSRLTAGRTVLVIAHRLHTITGVDRIVVLDHGSVAEAGPHEALLAARGRYHELWEAAR